MRLFFMIVKAVCAVKRNPRAFHETRRLYVFAVRKYTRLLYVEFFQDFGVGRFERDVGVNADDHIVRVLRPLTDLQQLRYLVEWTTHTDDNAFDADRRGFIDHAEPFVRRERIGVGYGRGFLRGSRKMNPKVLDTFATAAGVAFAAAGQRIGDRLRQCKRIFIRINVLPTFA